MNLKCLKTAISAMLRFIFKVFIDRTPAHYIRGFNQPHHQNYWLGLTHAHTITRSRDHYKLVVMATTVDGGDWVGEYFGFKVQRAGNEGQGIGNEGGGGGGFTATYEYYKSK